MEVYIRDVIEMILNKTKVSSLDIRLNAIATIACKASIKANHALNELDMINLIKNLLKCENPNTCPHGRPTMLKYTNYELEKYLANKHIEIKRYTNVSYLLFKKKRLVKKYLKKLKNIKYKMGADAMDNIYYTKYLIDNKYDGIIHIKSTFCTPEIGSMSVINKMCEENNMPVLFMSMDINTSKVGMETRLEAFYDMIEMRKNNE